MGKLESAPDPWTENGWTLKKSAKAQYGVKMPEGASPSGWDLVAQIAGGMFWPVAVDSYAFNTGAETTLKCAATMKFDLAGAINWSMVGSSFSFKIMDKYINFEPDSWVSWALNDTVINLDGRLTKLSASLKKSEYSGLQGLGRVVDASINLKEAGVGAVKLTSEIEASV